MIFRQCGLNENFENYTFIKYNSNTEKFIDESLAPILRSRNVSDDVIAYARNKLMSGRTRHSTVKSPIKPFLEARIRNSQYLLNLIMRMFYNDYKVFGFKLPIIPKK